MVSILVVAYLYSKEDIDVTGYLIVISIIACIYTSFTFHVPAEEFIDFFPMSSIIYLIFIDIFIKLLIKHRIFEYFSLKIIRYTKSNLQRFFYLICISSALISGIMDDVSVAIIIFPIIFRATKILKIEKKPFIYGTTASIIIGNLLTPLATPVNIILSETYNLDIGWYFSNLFLLFLVSLIVTLYLIDKFYLRNMDKPEQFRIKLLLEIMSPQLLIQDKKKFYRFLGYLIFIIIGLLINYYTYVFIALAVAIISIVEEGDFTQHFNGINWNIPLVFIGFFLLIGCIEINGTIAWVETGLNSVIQGNLWLAILIIYLVMGLVSSYIARTLATIIFISISGSLFTDLGVVPNSQLILLTTVLVAIHLGGNLVPQSSSFILKLLEQAKDRNISEIQYKSLTKILRRFTVLIGGIGFLYLIIFVFIVS